MTKHRVTMNRMYHCKDQQAVVVCIDAPGTLPVIAYLKPSGTVLRLDEFGVNPGSQGEWDIHEYQPWKDLIVDTPVWVRDSFDHPWTPGHFSHADEYGRPYIWKNGKTSHTAVDRSSNWFEQLTSTNPNPTQGEIK